MVPILYAPSYLSNMHRWCTKNSSCLEKVQGEQRTLVDREEGELPMVGGNLLPAGQIQLTGCFCMVHEVRVVFIF